MPLLLGLAAAVGNLLGAAVVVKRAPSGLKFIETMLAFGAGFMLAVDTVCRTAFATEVPPGVATAFVGTPVFIALLALAFRRSA